MKADKIREVVASMTLEEKASFIAGRDFWSLQGLEREGIPSIMVTDGPHGLRKQTAATDMLGLNESNPAIAFPAGCAQASAFDPAVAETVGRELGKLAQAENVGVVLGPALNIKRSPLCGRNFEYYSEDPLVSGRTAAAAIRGVQGEGVGACPKHYCANNQEYYRMTSNSVVDEQTMREIYLPGFETAVKDAQPWSIMCSYNRLNGTYLSENRKYLTEILKEEWGFDGAVMTDWGACDEPVESLAAGLDLEMPGAAKDNVRAVRSAAESGQLPMEVLDEAVARVLTMITRYTERHDPEMDGTDAAKYYDFEAGHAAARTAAEECAVLLRNEGGVLPLSREEKVVFLGEFAEAPRYQGGGSSHISPYRVTSAKEAVLGWENVSFAQGYRETASPEESEALLQEAVQAAQRADKAVIFAGLPESYESEGLDRADMNLPAEQNRLISAVAAVQPNTIVVLHNGAPVALPWLEEVAGVLEMYLGGEAVGEAAVNLLYGEVNPGGRLAETFPLRVEDTPCYPYYGVEKDDVVYREGRLVGYRFYETMKREAAFPFGYGLSYTSFAYSDLTLEKGASEAAEGQQAQAGAEHSAEAGAGAAGGQTGWISMTDEDTLTVRVSVTNTGSRAGKEVVQLYIGNAKGDTVRPLRELRDYAKVELQPGETKEVSFTLGKRAFAEWNEQAGDWSVPEGVYTVEIGRNASEILCSAPVQVSPVQPRPVLFTVNSPLGDVMKTPAGQAVLGQMMQAMKGEVNAPSESEASPMSDEATQATGMAMPLRALVSFAPDMTRAQAQQIVDAINAAQGQAR
ncbi:MAG: glycoside hydrolase family 3 C-terminal domain-containing protein [Eubacteriales bacterium]|nr:glycoside hydrolase family 3 C-terminal domain-containing protein [Eubacteriales bacterium]